MGTRGFLGWVIDDKVVLTYCQYDSYPDGVGMNLLRVLRGINIATLKDELSVIRLVNQEDEPTKEDRRQFAHLTQNVSTGKDWYSVLRDLQGHLDRMIENGIASTCEDEWPHSSVFCEWGYLVDLDNGVLEVYKGFQTELPIVGRWAGIPSDEGYYPVSRIAEWNLDALPDDARWAELEAR